MQVSENNLQLDNLLRGEYHQEERLLFEKKEKLDLQLEGVDQPEPEVHQGKQGHHVSAWMFRLSLPGDGNEDECFAMQKNTFHDGVKVVFLAL